MNILLADDRPLVRDEVALVLRGLIGPDAAISGVADFHSFERACEGGRFDLVVVNRQLPGAPPTDALARDLSRRPQVGTVLVTGEDDPEAMHLALAGGARGYLPRSAGADALRSAFSLVLSGGIFMPRLAPPAPCAPQEPRGTTGDHSGLTPRQREVLDLVRQGLPNKEIARRLGTTEGTVKNHVKAILRQLRVQNRTQAALARV